MFAIAQRIVPSCACVFPIALAVGCGSEFAEVQGTVTLDGQNVCAAHDVSGTVLFSPVEQGLSAGNGAVDESGQYTVFAGSTAGLRPGPYRVAISITRIRPAKTPGNPPSGQLMSPKSYADPTQSGLQADVKPGKNTFDFALTSQHRE